MKKTRMKKQRRFGFPPGGMLWLLGALGGVVWGAGEGPDPVKVAGLRGGLVVQLGVSDTEHPAAWSRTGRYLTQLLSPEVAAVAEARKALQARGHYGLVTAAPWSNPRRLPFAENLVNLLVVRDFAAPDAELFRVVAPGGTILVTDPRQFSFSRLAAAGFASVREAGGMLLARKPRPDSMDEWTHPRHDADGNAVSRDTQVGPPERVRWIAPAIAEVEGMVTAAGRNFYGGVLARDGFNGLRLWHRDLERGGLDAAKFRFPGCSSGVARPLASARYLLAVSQNKTVALDAATGEVVREFPGAPRPREMLYRGNLLVVADKQQARAFRLDTGRPVWSWPAREARQMVANDEVVALIHGLVRRGEKPEAVALDLRTGKVRWRRSDYPWLGDVRRLVLHADYLAFEVSSWNDEDSGNALHIVEARTGAPVWEKEFPPGMNHRRQARAMFVGDRLWVLHGGKVNTAIKEQLKHVPVEVSALDFLSGRTLATYPAGLAHCFPPVATPNYLFAGVLDMTDLRTGRLTANRITKANCSTEHGWIPANGLIYTTPKHCTCWPMLRGYTALAPGAPLTEAVLKGPLDEVSFALERGPARPDPRAPAPGPEDWPLYRSDAARSGGTAAAGPVSLAVRWSVTVAPREDVALFSGVARQPILWDWREDAFVKGPLSAPTVARGRVYVTRPHAHEVLALDADTGEVRWRFTADGRVDTPPAIHRGLCLFGTHGGSVYALRADTGGLAWRLRAGLGEEQIVAYGQLESPWPVPGAVLIRDDVAYFVAGRQPFADGGVLVFAVDPQTGQRRWARRVNTVPQRGYYENSALEFDPVDLLHAEGDYVTMSRWRFTREGKPLPVDKWQAFARLGAGAGRVWVPRGSWTYGPRHMKRFAAEPPRRPLVVFRDHSVFSLLNGTTTLFRRDFSAADLEHFNARWMTGWEAQKIEREGGRPFRTDRIAKKAVWTADVFSPPNSRPRKKAKAPGHNAVRALALAGNGRLYAVHQDGRLKVLSTTDGKVLAATQVPEPVWDGLAIARGRLYLATQTGRLLCLGARDEQPPAR